jgi:hypothetical protein
MSPGDRLQLLGLLNRNPKFASGLPQRLEYNAANAGVPKELEDFRKPSAAVRPLGPGPGPRP